MNHPRTLTTFAGLAIIVTTTSAFADAAPRAAEVRWIDHEGRAVLGDLTQELGDVDGAARAVIITQSASAERVSFPPGLETSPIGGVGLATSFVSNGSGDEGDTPTRIAFTPDGTKIIVAHRDSRNLTVFDAATRAVLDSIDLSGSPNDVAIAPGGTRAVTANIFEDTASIVDLTTGAETAVIPVGDQPGVVQINPSGTTAVVGNTVDASLSVIDIALETETSRINGVAFSASTSIAFEHGATVSRFTRFKFADNVTLLHPERFNSRVLFVDVGAGTVTPLITAANPDAVDVSPDGTTAVVSHASTSQLVSVIDVALQSVSSTIPTGADLNAGAIAINPSKTKAVVGILNSCRVADLVAGTVSSDLPTASISELLVTADGLRCVAVGFNGSLISFASESVLTNLNGLVSMQIGAHSPVDSRAAMAGSLFTEEMLVMNTSAPAATTGGPGLEDRLPSGPAPEGDKARHAEITPDGETVLAVNILSDNVSFIDPGASEAHTIVATGDRPSETAITPDGTTAVVANLDSTFATIVDITAGTSSTISITRRASQVEISPDGQYAYLAVVADGDGVWRINLNTMSVEGPKVLTGNMGGIFYNFSQTSGMTLSHDGATLVTCNSADGTISIIDTALWTEVERILVGTQPARAAFSPDDAIIYVTDKAADTLAVVHNAGASSFLEGTLPVGDQPFDVVIKPDGTRAFVGNYAGESITVFDLTPTGLPPATIALNEPVQGLRLDATGARLYASGGTYSVSLGPGPVVTQNVSGELTVIDTATNAILEQLDTGLTPANLAFNGPKDLTAIASPLGDGIFVATPCAEDLGGNGDVGFDDLLLILSAWGPCPGCPEDLDGDMGVGFDDLLLVLSRWGACL